ncbi:MAG: ATP-dependent DNA helicase RecG [Ruminococcaceae bacterium]|nr:ATP-dependent DNA helicase RecG [Oscillospiraceae bacterium]
MALTFDTDVRYLPGVGEARAAALAKLGIETVGALLYHFPRGYEFRGNEKPLADAVPGETASFILTAASDVQNTMIRRGMTISKLKAFDESGSCEILYFNQPFVKDSIIKGGEYRFYGKLTRDKGKNILNSPVVEPVIEGVELPALVAVYPLTAGITQKLLAKLVGRALEEIDSIPEILSDEIREQNNLCTISEAIRGIHAPENFEVLEIAKRRLIFEELYRFALGSGKKPEKSCTAPALTDGDITPLTTKLPYALTGAQTRAISQIAEDLASGKPMRRLVSGDVGSGKTIVAASAAYIAMKNGVQCALMAPTEILAVQHYNELAPLLKQLGISCGLLTGSVKGAARKALLAALADGSMGLVVGTHALITEDVQFAKLGLVICDEQHRFGVGQREALLRKGGGDSCHQLTMSATPIPRTLALFLYGDLDMSVLDELPPGRQRVETFVVNEGYRERLNGFIRKQHAEGHQTYVVCPSVEEAESGEVTQEDIRLFDFGYDVEEIMRPKSPPKAATVWAETLSEALPELRIGCVHGKMKPADKDDVMRRFAAGELDVLVSTTVIEVGVNVPNATLMIVENAERFGLSQLHQLRGRVGRGAAKSYCILVSDSKSGSRAADRLEVMRTTFDGFKIAEFDLGERGPGDFLRSGDEDVRQHGELRFRLANLCENMELFEAAVAAAKQQEIARI